MKDNTRVLQEMADTYKIVELVLRPEEIHTIVAMLVSAMQEMTSGDDVYVVHFLPLEKKVASGINKKLNILRIASIVHEDIVRSPDHIISVDPENEFKRVQNMIKLIKYKSR